MLGSTCAVSAIMPHRLKLQAGSLPTVLRNQHFFWLGKKGFLPESICYVPAAKGNIEL